MSYSVQSLSQTLSDIPLLPNVLELSGRIKGDMGADTEDLAELCEGFIGDILSSSAAAVLELILVTRPLSTEGRDALPRGPTANKIMQYKDQY